MKIKIFFSFVFICLLLLVSAIFGLVFNQEKNKQLETKKLTYLSIIPEDAENFVKITKELFFSQIQNKTVENLQVWSFLFSTVNQKTKKFLEKIDTQEVIKFSFQQEDFFLLDSPVSLLKYGSFYSFGPGKETIYFNQEDQIYFSKKNNFLIFCDQVEGLKKILQFWTEQNPAYLADNLVLNKLLAFSNATASLLGFYKASANFQIKDPFLFSFDENQLRISLLKAEQIQTEKKASRLTLNFANNIAEFSGENLASDLNNFKINFLENNKFFDELKQSYNLDLLINNTEEKILKDQAYQFFLFPENNFVFLTSQAEILDPIKNAWKIYLAQNYPEQVEKILPDGTKATHLIGNKEGFNFSQSELFGQAVQRLEKDGHDLIIAQLDPFYIITSSEALLQEALEQIKEKENLSFWLALKTKIKKSHQSPLLFWSIQPQALNQFISLKKEFLNLEEIEIEGHETEETLNFEVKFKQ